MYQWYGLGKSLQKTCWEGLELSEGGHCHNLTGNAQHMETFHSWGHWTVINTCLVKIILFIMDTGTFSCYEHSFWIPSWIVTIYAFCVICDTEPQFKTMMKKTERCLFSLPTMLPFFRLGSADWEQMDHWRHLWWWGLCRSLHSEKQSGYVFRGLSFIVMLSNKSGSWCHELLC